jgi:hypothetical protein
VFEGALRKWGVGEASIAAKLAYVSKDIVLATFLVLGLGAPSVLTRIAQPYLVAGLTLLACGAGLSAIFGIDLLGAVLTLKTFFVLPVACLLAGQLLPTDSLRRFARWIAILSVPLAVLGVLQFYSPSNSGLNRYSTMGEDVAATTSGVNERVRATGTFSYISGFGEFAETAVWAGIVTFTIARTVRERLLGYAAVGSGFCCALVTVSRAVALISLALVVVWALVGGQFGRKVRTAFTIAFAALAALFLTQEWDHAEEIVSTVYLRHYSEKNSDTFSGRLWYQFVHPMDALAIAPLGFGLGSQQSATMLEDATRRSQGMFESPWGRTIMEVGILGLLGFFVTLGVVFAPLIAAYRATKRSELRTVLAVTGAALMAKALLGFQFNHVTTYFFWATGASVLSLANGIRPPRQPRLASQVRSAKSASRDVTSSS